MYVNKLKTMKRYQCHAKRFISKNWPAIQESFAVFAHMHVRRNDAIRRVSLARFSRISQKVYGICTRDYIKINTAYTHDIATIVGIIVHEVLHYLAPKYLSTECEHQIIHDISDKTGLRMIFR